jgi:hypothetical protein
MRRHRRDGQKVRQQRLLLVLLLLQQVPKTRERFSSSCWLAAKESARSLGSSARDGSSNAAAADEATLSRDCCQTSTSKH